MARTAAPAVETATIPTTTTPTLDAFVSTLVGGGYARVIVAGPTEDRDIWFRSLDTGWHEVRPERVEPGFTSVLGRHGAERLSLSPCSWRHPWTQTLSFVNPVHALWGAVPVATEPVANLIPATRMTSVTDFLKINPESERQARPRLGSGRLPPSILVHEGVRLSAFWLVTSPLDPVDPRRLLHQIAMHFGVARDHQCEPERARFVLPFSPVINVIPARQGALDVFAPERRYDLSAITTWFGPMDGSASR